MAVALSFGFAGMLLFAPLLFAKAVEPGPEADGLWTCDKTSAQKSLVLK